SAQECSPAHVPGLRHRPGPAPQRHRRRRTQAGAQRNRVARRPQSARRIAACCATTPLLPRFAPPNRGWLLSFASCFLLMDAGSGIAHRAIMAYVITDPCTKDELCVQACPVDCIHPKQDEAGFAEAPQLFVQPDDCIDCGACVPVCPTNSIFVLDELPEDFARFATLNAAHYN